MVGDEDVNETGGVKTTTNNFIGNGSIIDLATTGWMPLGADLWGWSASLSMGNFENEAKIKTSGMSYMVNPFYTKTLAIKDGSNLYLNPGLAVTGFSMDIEKAKTNTSYMNVDFTLPIMFKVPVTESGSFTVQAGVSPSVALYHTGTVTDVDGKKTTSTAATDGLFATSGLSYGFGASYKPTEKLSMHALFDTASATDSVVDNDGDGANDNNKVALNFALGVDYHFGAAATVQE